jgi:hypothetical protein
MPTGLDKEYANATLLEKEHISIAQDEQSMSNRI